MSTCADYMQKYNYKIYCNTCCVSIHRAVFKRHCKSRQHLGTRPPKSDDTTYCEACDVIIHRASFCKHCTSKKHLQNSLHINA